MADKKTIWDAVMRSKANWLGYVMGRNGLLLGAIEGKV